MPADVTVKVAADASAVNNGLNSASKAVENFKKSSIGSFASLKSSLAGVFAVGAVQQGVSALLDEFGRIQDLADKFDESSESIQRVGYAAKVSGTDIETVATAMQKVNGNALDAIAGNAKLGTAFASLGVSAKDFVDLPMEEKLLLLSKGFEEGGSNAEKMDAVISILGKSGSELIPLLSGGADTLKTLFNEAGVAGDESVAKLAAAGDKIDKTFSNLKAAGATALAFIITKVEELWAGLNSVGIYLANLPDGFKAAADAVKQFQREFTDARKADEDAPKKKTDIAKIQAAAEKAAAKQDAKEKVSITKDAVKEEIEEGRRKAKEIEDLGRQERKFLDDQRKQAITGAADNLSDAENANRPVAVDSLRRIGGNLSKNESASIAKQLAQQKQQVDIARQQLDILKKTYELNRRGVQGEGSGAFTE